MPCHAQGHTGTCDRHNVQQQDVNFLANDEVGFRQLAFRLYMYVFYYNVVNCIIICSYLIDLCSVAYIIVIVLFCFYYSFNFILGLIQARFILPQ